MDKNEIESYIKRLQELEKEILNDDSNDESIMGDLNKLLFSLGDDIKNQVEEQVNRFEVKIKKLNPNAVIPSYSKEGDAAMDLTAVDVEFTDDYISYKTGIAIEIPKGYVGLVFPRSSNSKKDLLLTNSVGVIDSGYRGEIEIRYKRILNDRKGGTTSIYNTLDRVGQIMIIPYPSITFVEVDELSETERGDGGFGSTGK
jgi:dUTP pyrophosphatase